MPSIKTHEQYTITNGNFLVIAEIQVAGGKPKITLTKPPSFSSKLERDYHFELSEVEAVEQFAKCALEAVNIARSFLPKENKETHKKGKKKL